MKTLSKRLAALAVALAMTLTGLGAFAEAALTPQTPEAVFERGNYIKTEASLQLNVDAVSGLLAMTGSTPSDEGAATLINQVLAAINKMKATVISGKDAMSMVLGTDLAPLMDLQAVMGADVSASAITSSLLPGLKLTLPANPDTQKAQALIERHKEAFKTLQPEKLFAPYMKAVGDYFTNNILAKATLTPGTVEIAGVGSFDSVVTFDMTQEMVAGLVGSVTEVLKADAVVRGLLDAHLKAFAQQQDLLPGSAAQSSPAESEAPKDSAGIIAQMEKTAAELMKDPAKVVAHQGVYTNTSTMAVYTTTEDKDSTGQLSVAYKPLAAGHDLTVSIIVKEEDPVFAAVDPAVTEAPKAPVDWEAVKAAVLAGTDASTFVTLQTASSADLAANLLGMTLSLKAVVGGMQLGLDAKGSSALAGPYAAKGEVSISAFSPAPLLTLSFESTEVTEAPALPAAEGLKSVELNETALAPQSELSQVFQTVMLPKLIENLPKALPEEGPMMVMMIMGLLAPSPTPEAPK